jgi:V-type H+-transporting ATPase proteolipid subunit
LISVIFCEATAIYGLIIAVILAGKIGEPPGPTYLIPKNSCAQAYFAGYAFFWAGMAVGITNLVGGIAVGISGSNTVISDAADPSLFVKILIVGIMASALSIFGVIVGILMGTGVDFPQF